VSIADELQKLESLRQSGTLTDAEFAQAKARLLAGPAPAADGHAGLEQVGAAMSQQLAEVRYQNELARIDREWAMEREKYYITTRYGQRQLPSPGMGIAVGVIGGIFGIIWTVMAIAITGSAPSVGPFVVAKVVFPLFGVVFIVVAIVMGSKWHAQAQEFARALERYQQRRRAVRPEQSSREVVDD